MAEETKQEARPAPEPVPVDETSIAATYANFCRVTGTPEELIVDFGLNKQVVGNSPDTIQLNQRIIVNFFYCEATCSGTYDGCSASRTGFRCP